RRSHGMTRPICPMLQALPPTDAAGQPVNRECLLEPCRFYDGEARDCGLSIAAAASGRAAAASERVETGAERHARLAADAAAAPAEATMTRLTSMEGRLAASETAVAELLTRMASLVETQQKAAERMLEELSLLGARTQRSEQAFSGLAERM